jgi:hypothetical protein
MATGNGEAKGTATIAAAGDVATITTHNMADLTEVRVDTVTGGAVGVLVENAPYWTRNVTTDTFQLSASPGGNVMEFGADGGADVYVAEPVYDAPELRRPFGGLMYKGRPDLPGTGRFGARPGILQNTSVSEVSLSGTQVTVGDLTCVVNPTDGGTQAGPYLVAIPAGTHDLNPPDGSNTRIDLIVAEVLDDDEDSSGQRLARTRYVPGTAGAGTPATPAGTLLLATATVPVSPGAATLDFDGDFTVAKGGILPVRTTAGLPATFRREADYADLADADALVRFSGSAWEIVASANTPSMVEFATNGAFSKSNYKWGRYVIVHVQAAGGGGGGCAATSASQAAAAGGGGAGGYSYKIIPFSDLATSETVTVGVAGAGGGAGNNNGTVGGNSAFGAHCSATGGGFGEGVAASTGSNIGDGGVGGTATGGMLNVPGGDGFHGSVDGNVSPPQRLTIGDGGGSHLSGHRLSSAATQGGNGFAAVGKGGGGSGGHNRASQAARSGGTGGSGAVYVEVH